MKLEGRKLETQPIIGLSSAPIIYVDGIADLRFLGVNSQILFYAEQFDGCAGFRKAAVTLVGPSGKLLMHARTLHSFIKEEIPAGHAATPWPSAWASARAS